MAMQRRGKLMQLEIGMTKAEVINIMGKPNNREVYQQPDGLILEYLIYRTRYEYPYEENTPIAFIDGKVTGWGRNFYEQQKQRYEIEIKQSGR